MNIEFETFAGFYSKRFTNLIRQRRYGYVERKDMSALGIGMRKSQIEREKSKGRGIKTWKECVKVDIKRFDLVKDNAQNRNM